MDNISPPALARRIVTTNKPLPADKLGIQAEPAVSISTTEVAAESSLGGKATRASVGHHTSLPVSQGMGTGLPHIGILSEAEGKQGVCVTVNDLAPDAVVPMVSHLTSISRSPAASHDNYRLRHHPNAHLPPDASYRVYPRSTEWRTGHAL